MSAPGQPTVTLKQLAAKTRLSVAAVSYALRNHPKIPQATRQVVQAAARELGYRPNPRVASLMAHIRRADHRHVGERLAFLWVHTTRQQSHTDPFLRSVFRGARDRAAQVGFGLEEFWTADAGMTDERLEQILRARGIVGVVLSPVTTSDVALTLNWDWRHFAPAVIGNVTWTPELHHAGHHHYLAMRMVLSELAKFGRSRPCALIEHTSNERAKRAWDAALFTHHPRRKNAPSAVRVVRCDDPGDIAGWLRHQRPDTLIVSEVSLLDLPGVRAVVRELSLPIVTLYWSSEIAAGIGGVDQCYDRIAAHAVDLVVAQLNSNEFGVPDLPRIMLFPGRWVAPRMPRARPSKRGARTSRPKTPKVETRD